MRCPRCGYELQPEDRFCSECGWDRSTADQPTDDSIGLLNLYGDTYESPHLSRLVNATERSAGQPAQQDSQTLQAPQQHNPQAPQTSHPQTAQPATPQQDASQPSQQDATVEPATVRTTTATTAGSATEADPAATVAAHYDFNQSVRTVQHDPADQSEQTVPITHAAPITQSPDSDRTDQSG
ncbi:zinc ribbon domain-containing protein, partial [Bifidobacterium simiarum]|uniref:zinc ribbon domain-containing protein n=1 Tax=Bifidobacterium simiarum TaxID=2045441 RepID=UPI001BDD8A07